MKSSTLKRKGRRRFPNRENRAFVAWLHELPCLICTRGIGTHQPYPTSVDHLQTRGAGGADLGNCVPLCGDGTRGHHGERHSLGIRSFQAKHGINLAAEAERLQQEWEAR